MLVRQGNEFTERVVFGDIVEHQVSTYVTSDLPYEG
jgi:hypothetical protein